MISMELIRKDPDYVRRGLLKRGEDAPITELAGLDSRRRGAIQRGDELRARRNEASRTIGRLNTEAGRTPVPTILRDQPVRDDALTTDQRRAKQLFLEAQELKEEMRQVGEEIKGLEQEVASLESRMNGLLLEIPNIPRDDVPEGLTEDENVAVSSWGELPSFDFTPLPHWDLGQQLGIIDFQRGVKLAGPRSFILTGMGAKLERAIINWMLDLHTNEHGYVEM